MSKKFEEVELENQELDNEFEEDDLDAFDEESRAQRVGKAVKNGLSTVGHGIKKALPLVAGAVAVVVVGAVVVVKAFGASNEESDENSEGTESSETDVEA